MIEGLRPDQRSGITNAEAAIILTCRKDVYTAYWYLGMPRGLPPWYSRHDFAYTIDSWWFWMGKVNDPWLLKWPRGPRQYAGYLATRRCWLKRTWTAVWPIPPGTTPPPKPKPPPDPGPGPAPEPEPPPGQPGLIRGIDTRIILLAGAALIVGVILLKD